MFFNSQTLSSYTLDHTTAISYADRNCCIMRVKLNKGCKAILIDNISPYNEAEILLPFDTKYNIDYPIYSLWNSIGIYIYISYIDMYVDWNGGGLEWIISD